MTEVYAFGDLYDTMYRDYTPDIPFYVEEARKAEPPVLELACGTGRILIPVAQAEVRIWGVDVSADMLSHAERKVADLPAVVRGRITLHMADMGGFRLSERFGLVMIPFRSFLHLMTVEDQMAALHNIREHLLARTGFVAEALYGDFNRAPFDENSTEMVWITRRDG